MFSGLRQNEEAVTVHGASSGAVLSIPDLASGCSKYLKDRIPASNVKPEWVCSAGFIYTADH